MSEPKTLQFSPPQSSFNPSFWETLYERKLNIYKLANPSIEVSPQYEISSNGSPGSISFSANSFGESSSLNSLLTKLILTDSLEEFTAFDKRALLEKISAEGLAVMITGEAIERPELLQRFALLVFADLKSYKFFYWFCHAAITFPQIAPFHCRQFGPISERDSRVASSPFKSHRFLSKMYSYMTSTLDFSLIFAARYDSDSDTFATTTLSEAWQERYEENTCLVLLDLSPSPSSLGWAARNLLTLLSLYTTQDRESRSLPSELLDAGQKTVRIIVVRNAKWRNRLSQNYSSEEELATLVRADESIFVECEVGLTAPLRVSHSSGESRSFGWELNDRGKPGPRVADLSALLNTRLLMNQAVDLNLRLMKWRMWPALQVDALAKKRCLLLGAGTLGCAVARCLMGWGVRHITLVDNGIVSFSNPVRQSLFEYEDCVARRFKAVAAAERLVKIFPEINARAVVMTIPMPGHPFAPPSSSTKTSDGAIGGVLTDETAVRELDALIRDHDYIFALTDSREARWLPTVIARAYDKPVINSALGFDSYLVMQQRGNFGCYFCNDIIAAGNSRQGRPLDEQCTVTRPGLSFIAGGLCGEMFVALVHEESDDIRERNPAPHQIRGYLSDFSQMTLEGARFSMCTACSQLVLQRYRTEGDRFVRAVAEKPTILEEISGISQMTANIDVETFIDSDDDF